jgi:hypothetical protein
MTDVEVKPTTPELREQLRDVIHRIQIGALVDLTDIVDDLREIADAMYRRTSKYPVARARHGDPLRTTIIQVGREKFAALAKSVVISDRTLSATYQTSTRVISHILAGKKNGKPIWRDTLSDAKIWIYDPALMDDNELEPWDDRGQPRPPGCVD